MPGFLLQDDAIAERKRRFDEWIAEQQQNLQQTLAPSTPEQTAATAPVSVPAPAPAPVDDPQVEERRARFQSWIDQQQQAALPTLAQPTQPSPLEQRAASPEVEQRRQSFQTWVDQQQQGGQPTPPAAPAAPAAPAPAEQPATPAPNATDAVPLDRTSGRVFPVKDYQGQVDRHWGDVKGGADLFAPRGTPVVAMEPGRVVEAGENSVGGNSVLVQGNDGLQYYYAHGDSTPSVKVGDQVTAGQYLMPVGDTGDARGRGTHLHIGIGPDIRLGADKYGGTGGDFDATALLRSALEPQQTAAGVPTTAGLSGGGGLAGQVGERGQQILQGAAQAADWLGSEGQKALQAVLVTEGGLTGARGDQGKSAGPLQFFGEEGGRAGQLNAFANALGMTLDQARQYATEHPLEAIAWAIGTVANPGYLGAVIGSGIAKGLTGPELATYVQRNGQVSVSPERAGQVWQNLFGGGQGPTTTTEPARSSPLGGLLQQGAQAITETSAQARARAEQLAGETGSALQASQAQGRQLLADLDRSRQEFQRQGEQYRSGLLGQIDQARQDVLAPREFPGLQQARALLESPLAQQALNEPVLPGGQSLARLGQTIHQVPETLGALGRGLEGASTEAERQQREGLLTTAAVEGGRVGAGLAGRVLSPEAEEFLRGIAGSAPAAVQGAQADPGGVVAAFLKSSGIAPPEMTVSLPGLGDVPTANIVGLGANLMLPTGGEARFGEGALHTGLTETSRLGRPSQQLGAAFALEQGLGRAGRFAADRTQAATLATSAIGRWARASVDDIMQDLARGPVGELLRSESGELSIDALRGLASDVKQQMVRLDQGAPVGPGSEPSIRSATISGRQGGQIQAQVAARLGTTAGGGALGYATAPEDATPEDRMKRGVAGALAAGTLAFGGPRLAQMSPTTRAQAQDVATWLRANTPSQATAGAVGQALGPQTGGERVAEWISSNLLSGPGLVWNVVNQSMHLGWQPLLRAAEGHPIEALRGLQAVVAAAPEALERGWNVVAHGAPYAGVGGQQGRPLARTSLGLRFNLAGDAVLRTLNEHLGGMLEAQRLIREAGATTQQATQAVIAQNAARIAQVAEREGQRSALTTGAGRTPWLNSLGMTKTSLLRDPNPLKQVAGVLLHVGMPFARVPEELLYQVGRNSPVIGQLIDVMQIVKAAPGDSRREATAKAALNATMSAAMIGAVLNDQVRGADDPEHPNAVNIGGQWLPTTTLGTLGGRMAVVTAVVDGLRKAGTEPNSTAMDRIARAVNNVGKLTEQEYPLADQIRLLSRIGQGNLTGAASGFASDLLAGMTPVSGALGAAENVTDPYARQVATSGWGDVYEPNLARIPGLAGTLPTQVNMLTGEPLRRPSSGPGALLRLQNVERADNPIAREIIRLEKLGYQIPEPKELPKQVGVRGATIPLTEAEQRSLAVSRGQLIQSQLERYMTSSYWGQLTDDQKAQMIARAMSRASARNAVTWQRAATPEDVRQRVAAGRRVVGRLEPQAV